MAREDDEVSVLISRPFLGVVGALLALCGVVIGLWSSSIERKLERIERILDERASLPHRVANLEEQVRELRRDHYIQGPRREYEQR